jgi:hypothetical protein
MTGATRKLGELEFDVLLEQIAEAHLPRRTRDLRGIDDPHDSKTYPSIQNSAPEYLAGGSSMTRGPRASSVIDHARRARSCPRRRHSRACARPHLGPARSRQVGRGPRPGVAIAPALLDGHRQPARTSRLRWPADRRYQREICERVRAHGRLRAAALRGGGRGGGRGDLPPGLACTPGTSPVWSWRRRRPW